MATNFGGSGHDRALSAEIITADRMRPEGSRCEEPRLSRTPFTGSIHTSMGSFEDTPIDFGLCSR